MEPQKSIVLPIVLSILGTALIVGGGAYYFGMNQAQDQPTTVVTTKPVSITPTPSPSPSTNPANLPITSPDTTVNWKTYTNAKFGLTFKYPSTWSVKDQTSKNDTVVLLDLELSDNNKKYVVEESTLNPVSTTVTKDTVNGSIHAYLTGGREPLNDILKTETIIIGGKTAYVLQGVSAPSYHDTRLVFSGGYIFGFDSNAHLAGRSSGDDPIGTTETQAINKIFDQILATVEITK